jgi:ribosomal protein S18 acetylase RimI-like enzyme
MAKMLVRNASERDLRDVKSIADASKHELGFVLLPALQAAVVHKWLLVLIQDDVLVGFVHFRHRRDHVTKIYQICVAERFRRQKCGSLLLQSLQDIAQRSGQTRITLSCPCDLPSNTFYKQQGFSMERIEASTNNRRKLIVWSLPLETLKEI